MRTYEKSSTSPDGWNVTCTLKLTDDGRFSYSEGWTDHTNASLSGGAEGTWRRGVGYILFRAESAEGPMYFPWEAGRELLATVQGGALLFPNGWTLSPPPPPKPKPRVTPKIMVPVESAAGPPTPRFVPRAPSPELAALLRRWIDELPAEVLVNRIQRLCREHDALPLDANQFEVWALRTDGQVLYIDHDSFAQRAEPVEDADTAYDKIELGMKKYPELLELLPPDRGWPS